VPSRWHIRGRRGEGEGGGREGGERERETKEEIRQWLCICQLTISGGLNGIAFCGKYLTRSLCTLGENLSRAGLSLAGLSPV